MIICCHTAITHEWSEQELADKLLLLPPEIRTAAMRKTKWVDRQLSIAGKLLLVEVLRHFNLADQLSLEGLQYNSNHRPYFDAAIDFNIAHSGNKVVCCGTDEGMIGIDIEQIKPIGLEDYTDYFTPNEWEKINSYPNQFDGFYDFWTRKEAVLKAIGTGFHTPLSSVDVTENTVVYDEVEYFLQKLNIREGYQCHVATTAHSSTVQLVSVAL